MIYGIGTDILRRERIVAAWARRGERFAARILGPDELAVFRRRSARLPERGITYLATRFAAKEAFSKAIGLGMRMPMTWRGVQILKERSGKPKVVPNGVLAVWMAERRLVAHISVSDEADQVIAFAIVEVAPDSVVGTAGAGSDGPRTDGPRTNEAGPDGAGTSRAGTPGAAAMAGALASTSPAGPGQQGGAA